MHRRRATRIFGGFTLIECIVALAILGVVLLMSMSAIGYQERLALDLKVRGKTLTAMEAVLESLRAGAVTVESGAVEWAAPPPTLDLEGIDLTLEVTPIEPAGLYDIEIRGGYRLRGLRTERAIHTIVWRAP